MIGNNHEKDLSNLLEILKDTAESREVIILSTYGLGPGTVLSNRYAGQGQPQSRSGGLVLKKKTKN